MLPFLGHASLSGSMLRGLNLIIHNFLIFSSPRICILRDNTITSNDSFLPNIDSHLRHYCFSVWGWTASLPKFLILTSILYCVSDSLSSGSNKALSFLTEKWKETVSGSLCQFMLNYKPYEWTNHYNNKWEWINTNLTFIGPACISSNKTIVDIIHSVFSYPLCILRHMDDIHGHGVLNLYAKIKTLVHFLCLWIQLTNQDEHL